MPLRILVIPDKFKGTLPAAAAAEAIATGWRRARPHDSLESLPMTDGGDGFGEVMSRLLEAEVQSIETVDAVHRPVAADWWWEPKTATAIIESARVVGLALFPAKRFHPFELDTFGLGALLRTAAAKGAKRCLMGIGGSATNDAGFGLARSLGWRFFNKHDEKVERWTELSALTHLIPPKDTTRFNEFIVAVDVQNPLLGPAGCTRVYGPQKGLGEEDFEFAERCLQQLAAVTKRQLGLRFAGEPGAGAAGGLGFGLRCFAGAQLESGFDVFARHADLTVRVRSAQLVLTGEGRVDEQTPMGKGVGELARMCVQVGVPCMAFAGEISDPSKTAPMFGQAYALTPDFTSRANALAEPGTWLEKLAEKAAWRWA